MSDITDALQTALQSALAAAKPTTPVARNFVTNFLKGRAAAFVAIAEGLASGDIDEGTARYLLMQEGLLLTAEAEAVAGLSKVALQAAADAFLKSLTDSIKALLKIAL